MPNTPSVRPDAFVVAVHQRHEADRVAMLVHTPVLATRLDRLTDLHMLSIQSTNGMRDLPPPLEFCRHVFPLCRCRWCLEQFIPVFSNDGLADLGHNLVNGGLAHSVVEGHAWILVTTGQMHQGQCQLKPRRKRWSVVGAFPYDVGSNSVLYLIEQLTRHPHVILEDLWLIMFQLLNQVVEMAVFMPLVFCQPASDPTRYSLSSPSSSSFHFPSVRHHLLHGIFML